MIPAPRLDTPAAAPSSRASRYRIETWGCQMNDHDSEKMAGVLAADGMAPAASDGEADVFLLNTCAVREKAAEKVFARLGRLRTLKRLRPDVVIGVCGCVAQLQQDEIFRRAPHVDFVMGPRNLGNLAHLVRSAGARRRQIAVFDPRDRILPEAPEVAMRAGGCRAYVTIMEGCNKGCTFCIVPITRGRETCRAPEAILDEAGRAAADGYLEVQLLGQNVNAYRSGAWDFTRLLGAVSRVPGLRRVRFTTSHPLHFKNSIADLMAAAPSICPFLHLPVQSGSNAVLARMRRGYTREEYLAKVDYARARVSGLALSTDILVGFPGETDADFERTLSLVTEVRYDSIFSFEYSPRPGTRAALMPDEVPPGAKRERLLELQRVQAGIQGAILRGCVGAEEEILVEGPSALDPRVLAGRTTTNKIVNVSGPVEWTGRIVRVRIVEAGANSLCGEPVEPRERAAALTSPDGRDIYAASSVPVGGTSA